jgi:hypothetical protein
MFGNQLAANNCQADTCAPRSFYRYVDGIAVDGDPAGRFAFFNRSRGIRRHHACNTKRLARMRRPGLPILAELDRNRTVADLNGNRELA